MRNSYHCSSSKIHPQALSPNYGVNSWASLVLDLILGGYDQIVMSSIEQWCRQDHLNQNHDFEELKLSQDQI